MLCNEESVMTNDADATFAQNSEISLSDEQDSTVSPHVQSETCCNRFGLLLADTPTYNRTLKSMAPTPATVASLHSKWMRQWLGSIDVYSYL